MLYEILLFALSAALYGCPVATARAAGWKERSPFLSEHWFVAILTAQVTVGVMLTASEADIRTKVLVCIIALLPSMLLGMAQMRRMGADL